MNYVADQSFRIERVKISDSDIAIEGDFNPPPLACLSVDDQLSPPLSLHHMAPSRKWKLCSGSAIRR
jgi:hypothetical protein